MNTRLNKLLAILQSTLMVLSMVVPLSVLIIAPLEAQKKNKMKSAPELEKTQDRIEALTIKIYEAADTCPEFAYSFAYNEHGALDHVNVTGVNNAALRETLTSDLEELEALRSEIRNMPTRTHIYYVAESLPIPKAGYKEFYNDLYGHIAYPEQSKEAGIEGTVFVKFIVDDNGTIDYITADSNIGADRRSWRLSWKKKPLRRSGRPLLSGFLPGSKV